MNHWLFEQMNVFARATPWLHGPAKAFADHGIVLFAVLLAIGWWVGRRTGDSSRVAAAITAGASTLIAVAINQPIALADSRLRPVVLFAQLP